MDKDQVRQLRTLLLRWYRREHRDLPWRRDQPEPYHVLVSELMLQQTQVATVVDYFGRFIEAFGTVGALAQADEQDVLRLWQGLGYYRRARHLHGAARAIMDRHGGQVPDAFDDLMKLPGVGRYTAGAIASIAFGKQVPVVDGNVARVLSRWFAIGDCIDLPRTQKALWALAEALVPRAQPGQFNQAMMELGSQICTLRNPDCPRCPVLKLCDAGRRGNAQRYPLRSARRRPRAVTHHIVAIERRGRFLFEKRPPEGLWSNLWQLPTAQDLSASTDAPAIKDWVRSRFCLRIRTPTRHCRFKHQTTHRTIRFTLWRAAVASGRLRRGAGTWRPVAKVHDLPMANPQRRVIELLTRLAR